MEGNKNNLIYTENEFIREEFEDYIRNSSLSEEDKEKMLENVESGLIVLLLNILMRMRKQRRGMYIIRHGLKNSIR